jgi:hypothetical protein
MFPEEINILIGPDQQKEEEKEEESDWVSDYSETDESGLEGVTKCHNCNQSYTFERAPYFQSCHH